ncbi:PIR protein [Plasmodium ovale]|uniref:PIR Superfamily Protein n=2 Tax=Plasmodium ovale TaxID=36330 RepID=A0A1A8WR80_PLAOA|nr:PIR Superfamily Protein [Plasmodium ovale curtisi]SBT02036.1 PIR Superfamily Protein [Plasmodium ovale curtisi]SBT85156.1 PIR protein [Plasmodium ovale]
MDRREISLDKTTLPSVIFLKFLYENNNVIEKLNSKIKLYKSDSNYEEIISIIEDEFKKIQNEIEDTFRSDHVICCRNINYYFDLLNATIKSANVFSRDIQDNIIAKVEQQWKQVLNVKNVDECTKEIDLYSLRKRCILKHLHDLKLDKNFIILNPNDYETFLKEKWEKLLGYTNPELGYLYVKIENDFVGIIEQYSNFLYSYDYICDFDLDKLSPDDITISPDMHTLINNISLDKISSNNINKACYNTNYIEMLKIKTSSIQRMNNILSIVIALMGFSLMLIFLYRFSPLGNMLRRYKKKKNEVDENTSEELPELYENTENIGRYISYTSVSH